MSWRTTWNGNWKTSLAAALTSYTVKLGPVASVDADDNAVAAIWCTSEWAWNPTLSPIGCRTYDVTVYLGVVVQGMDDADSVDDQWDALDTVEDAVWVLLAPGTFRNTNLIDEVMGVKCRLGTAREGAVVITLRVRKV